MTKLFELEIKRTIPAPVKSVFEAWLTEDAIKNFMCPMDGVEISLVEVDSKENGKFDIVMRVGDSDIPIHGEYRKIDRYNELSFSWLGPHTGENSFVTLTFSKLSETKTELTLRHTGLESEESRNNHEGGWGHIIDRLSRFLK